MALTSIIEIALAVAVFTGLAIASYFGVRNEEAEKDVTMNGHSTYVME